jgi:hypothetical protein
MGRLMQLSVLGLFGPEDNEYKGIRTCRSLGTEGPFLCDAWFSDHRVFARQPVLPCSCCPWQAVLTPLCSRGLSALSEVKELIRFSAKLGFLCSFAPVCDGRVCGPCVASGHQLLSDSTFYLGFCFGPAFACVPVWIPVASEKRAAANCRPSLRGCSLQWPFGNGPWQWTT